MEQSFAVIREIGRRHGWPVHPRPKNLRRLLRKTLRGISLLSGGAPAPAASAAGVDDPDRGRRSTVAVRATFPNLPAAVKGIVFSFLFLWFAASPAFSPAAAAEAAPPASLPVFFFYNPACATCAEAQSAVKNAEEKFGRRIRVVGFNLNDADTKKRAANINRYLNMLNLFKVEENPGTAVFAGSVCLKDKEIGARLFEVLEDGLRAGPGGKDGGKTDKADKVDKVDKDKVGKTSAAPPADKPVAPPFNADNPAIEENVIAAKEGGKDAVSAATTADGESGGASASSEAGGIAATDGEPPVIQDDSPAGEAGRGEGEGKGNSGRPDKAPESAGVMPSAPPAGAELPDRIEDDNPEPFMPDTAGRETGFWRQAVIPMTALFFTGQAARAAESGFPPAEEAAAPNTWDIDIDALLAEDPEAENRRLARQRVDFWMIGAAGLVDGVNPCAFATVVLLVAMMASARRSRRETLVMGVTFTVAVYVTYFAIALVLREFLRRLESFGFLAVADLIYIFAFVLCVVCALLSLADAITVFRGRKAEDVTLKLPERIKLRIQKVISRGVRSSSLALGTFVAGVLVSGLESVCTGQVLFPILQGISQEDFWLAFALVAWYCLLFVLPLVAVFLAAYFGVGSQKLARVARGNLGWAKLLLALVFAAMGAWLWPGIASRWPPGARPNSETPGAEAAGPTLPEAIGAVSEVGQ